MRKRLNLIKPVMADCPPAAEPATLGEPEACLDLRPRPLPQMQLLQVAVVEDVIGDADDLSRLKAMGLCTGRRLQLIKMGDPLIVRVLGSRIGISARLADCVAVRPCMLSGE